MQQKLFQRKKKKKRKKKLLQFTITTLPVVIGGMYTVVNDERMQHYLSGIDNEMEKLRMMIDKLEIDENVMTQLVFKTKCGSLINMYTEWRNKFAERANAMLYTKIGTGTILMSGLTGFWFGIPILMTSASIATPFVAAYGAWYYFTSDKKKVPEKENFDAFFRDLKELNNFEIIGCYPSVEMENRIYPDLNSSDFNFPSVPTAPFEQYEPQLN